MARAGYLAGILGSTFKARRGLAASPDRQPINEQCRVLMSISGEAQTLRLARSILATDRDLERKNGRMEVFDYLTNELDIDAHRVAQEAKAYGSDPTAQDLSALLEASEPKRQTLFRKLNQAEGANSDVFNVLREAATNDDGEKLDVQSENSRSLAAHDLARQKRNGWPSRRSCGAVSPLQRYSDREVLAGANMSAKGLSQSCGAMVNYPYRLMDVEQNSERLATDGAIPLSRRVQSLVKSAQSLLGRDKEAAAE